MNALKLLVIVIFLIVEISGEQTKREGRCGGKPMKASGFKSRQSFKKKPHTGAHKFNIQSKPADYLPLPETELHAYPEEEHGYETGYETGGDNDQAYDNPTNFDIRTDLLGKSDYLVSNPSEYGDGDYRTARSHHNFHKLKSFHDESQLEHRHHDHDHINWEDHHYSHKSFRTARNNNNNDNDRSSGGWPSNPNLGSTLSALQVATANQGAEAGSDSALYAVGGNVVYGSTGVSQVEGVGSSSVAGYTQVTSGGESSGGWKSAAAIGESQTFQGINVGNSAQAGEHVDVIASGLQASVTNSGSSETSGSGSIYTSGTTIVQNNNAGGSNGWNTPN